MGQSSTKSGVIVWGSTEHSQLGISGTTDAEEMKTVGPRLLEAFRSPTIRVVECGGHQSAAIKENGDLYTWGLNKQGQLGHGDTNKAALPKLVRALHGKVSCGESHTAACLEDGTVYTWGCSDNGRLGHSFVKGLGFSGGDGGGSNIGIRSIVSNAFTSNGGVEKEEKGDGPSARDSGSPSSLMDGGFAPSSLKNFGFQRQGSRSLSNSPSPVASFGAQKSSTASTSSPRHSPSPGSRAGSSPSPFSSASSTSVSSHGSASSSTVTTPTLVDTLVDYFITDVKCGGMHSLFLGMTTGKRQSVVFSCGLGLSGRLGQGDELDRFVPTPITHLQYEEVSSIACGEHHSACVTEEGRLYMWGGGAFGKLGIGSRLSHHFPTLVQGPLASRLVTGVSLGAQHSACTTIEGELFTWGQAGRLGHEGHGETDEMVPRQVAALSGLFVLHVSCGRSHTAAVLETGGVWAWGTSRALGHGDPTAAPNTPTSILPLSGKAVIHLSCGQSHTIALSDFGRLSNRITVAAKALKGVTASSDLDISLDDQSTSGGGGGGKAVERGSPTHDEQLAMVTPTTDKSITASSPVGKSNQRKSFGFSGGKMSENEVGEKDATAKNQPNGMHTSRSSTGFLSSSYVDPSDVAESLNHFSPEKSGCEVSPMSAALAVQTAMRHLSNLYPNAAPSQVSSVEPDEANGSVGGHGQALGGIESVTDRVSALVSCTLDNDERQGPFLTPETPSRTHGDGEKLTRRLTEGHEQQLQQNVTVAPSQNQPRVAPNHTMTVTVDASASLSPSVLDQQSRKFETFAGFALLPCPGQGMKSKTPVQAGHPNVVNQNESHENRDTYSSNPFSGSNDVAAATNSAIAPTSWSPTSPNHFPDYVTSQSLLSGVDQICSDGPPRPFICFSSSGDPLFAGLERWLVMTAASMLNDDNCGFNGKNRSNSHHRTDEMMRGSSTEESRQQKGLREFASSAMKEAAIDTKMELHNLMGTETPYSLLLKLSVLSGELQRHQLQSFCLTNALLETVRQLEASQQREALLRIELESVRKSFADAGDQLETLRAHYFDQIKELEQRLSQQESRWRAALQNAQLHGTVSSLLTDDPVGEMLNNPLGLSMPFSHIHSSAATAVTPFPGKELTSPSPAQFAANRAVPAQMGSTISQYSANFLESKEAHNFPGFHDATGIPQPQAPTNRYGLSSRTLPSPHSEIMNALTSTPSSAIETSSTGQSCETPRWQGSAKMLRSHLSSTSGVESSAEISQVRRSDEKLVVSRDNAGTERGGEEDGVNGMSLSQPSVNRWVKDHQDSAVNSGESSSSSGTSIESSDNFEIPGCTAATITPGRDSIEYTNSERRIIDKDELPIEFLAGVDGGGGHGYDTTSVTSGGHSSMMEASSSTSSATKCLSPTKVLQSSPYSSTLNSGAEGERGSEGLSKSQYQRGSSRENTMMQQTSISAIPVNFVADHSIGPDYFLGVEPGMNMGTAFSVSKVKNLSDSSSTSSSSTNHTTSSQSQGGSGVPNRFSSSKKANGGIPIFVLDNEQDD